MFCDLIMGYVHINDQLQAIELSSKDRVEKSKNVTLNSITKNWKRSHADVYKASEKEHVKEGERKDILTQNMHK